MLLKSGLKLPEEDESDEEVEELDFDENYIPQGYKSKYRGFVYTALK
jgi:hypothetical protein